MITNLIKEVLEDLTIEKKAQVKHGFLEDYDIQNRAVLPFGGQFIIELRRTLTNTISVNFNKDFKRVIRVTYYFNQKIKENSNEIIEWHDHILKRLVDDERIKVEVKNIEYEYEVELIKNSQNDLTGVIRIITDITLIERRKNGSFNS
ncbi:hypothetical protein [Caviibacter abscessus]|uniref:hypothetical protein n=1 Tax=Caviibacter abscessus TaxID=1766719 RepID=UPI0008397717|nr:hypothetical protein [Caviibacter abscessus]